MKEGDKLLINGSRGNHAIAVLGARNNLSFTTTVLSDEIFNIRLIISEGNVNRLFYARSDQRRTGRYP